MFTTQAQTVQNITQLLKVHGYDPLNYDVLCIADEYRHAQGGYESILWAYVDEQNTRMHKLAEDTSMTASDKTSSLEVPPIFDVAEMTKWLQQNFYNVSPDRFLTAKAILGRNHGPALLFDIYYSGRLSKKDLALVIGHVWSDAEYPARAFDPSEMWLDLFEDAGYTVDNKPAERPTTALRLYRGATMEHKAGWSWTDDLTVAQRFAGGLVGRTPGRVWTALAQPVDLLARLNGREENEYVVNPSDLTIEEHPVIG